MGQSNLVISVRNVKTVKGKKIFGNEPGPTLHLDVPDGKFPDPIRDKVSANTWRDEVMKRAETSKDPETERAQGDVLVFIHGYNNGSEVIIKRHDLLQKRLKKAGYKGAVVSFDWPSAESTLNYLEDRSDAKATAQRLVTHGIKPLAMLQLQQEERKCDISVHLLGHSTGAYVIREAFSDADQNSRVARVNWTVSQVIFVGGDISAKSLSAASAKSQSLLRHSTRITNYSNPFDSVLKLSNAKRIGMSPRVGRVGLPMDAHSKCVDVDCGDHWDKLKKNDSNAPGTFEHSWHFDDQQLIKDLYLTLQGDIDRHRIPTRVMKDGRLHLRPAKYVPA